VHDHPRDPSLPTRSSARRSPVLRSPRTPAARWAAWRSAWSSHLVSTKTAQTGLSCSATLLQRVLRPIPREDRAHAPNLARSMLPSPRHDRLGSPIVSLSRLQASLHVAARAVAPSVEALDVRLGNRGSLRVPRTCYPVLRRLPGRDFHPLEKRSGPIGQAALRPLPVFRRHDATWRRG
jgi:hypothetical protein